MISARQKLNNTDYEVLLQLIVDGDIKTKVQSLKKINNLIDNDQQTFQQYGKKIVLVIQDLLLQTKENINLISSKIVLKIINFNYYHIKNYIQTKLLKNIVINLGNPITQIRKISHHCLLAYIKINKNFDQIIPIYIKYGILNQLQQIRQKSINSFQSILILQIKQLNWSSIEVYHLIEQLLVKRKDESGLVQRATNQCLVTLCKCDELYGMSKKLQKNILNELKIFCQQMQYHGILKQNKLYNYQKSSLIKISQITHLGIQNIHQKNNQINQCQIKSERDLLAGNMENINKINKKNCKSKFYSQLKYEPTLMKKAQSVNLVAKRPAHDLVLPALRKSYHMQNSDKFGISRTPGLKLQKIDSSQKKLIEDLKNDTDWKIRLQAIQQFQHRYYTQKQSPSISYQKFQKNYLQILLNLLGDSNLKISLISYKLIQDIIQKLQNNKYNQIMIKIIYKISDTKILLRKNIFKLIKNLFFTKYHYQWVREIFYLFNHVGNNHIKEQIINTLIGIVLDHGSQSGNNNIQSLEEIGNTIIQQICPIMDNLKQKIKVKILDLLALLSLKSLKMLQIKDLLSSKLNNTDYQMYLQKISNVSKNYSIQVNQLKDISNPENKNLESPHFSNKCNYLVKIDKQDSTSSTLRRVYSCVQEQNSIKNRSERGPLLLQKSKSTYEAGNKKQQQFPGHIKPNGESSLLFKSQRKTILKRFHQNKKLFQYKSSELGNFSSPIQWQPFSHPQQQLKNVLQQIKNDNWQICTEALSKLRKIIYYHNELLTQQIIKIVIPQILRLIQSLRSNLSKNAIMVLNDLSNTSKRMLDCQLQSIFSKLIKKTLDTNSFIFQEVRRVLISVCSNCNESKVLNLLTKYSSQKAIPIKISIICILKSISFIPKFYQKQIQKIIHILTNFLDEGSLEIREQSKTLLTNIINNSNSQSLLKMIPHQHISKIKIKQPHKSDIKQCVNEHVRNEIKGEEIKIKKKKKLKANGFPVVFNQLQNLLQKCESKDWKQRYSAMTSINQAIIMVYPNQFSEHKLSDKFIEVMSKQITDSNLKVSTNALRILNDDIQSKVPQIINRNLPILINQVFTCLSSNKLQVKQLAESVLNQIIDNNDKLVVIQHLCNGVMYGVQKNKLSILTKLTQILSNAYEKENKVNLINKNIFPLINKLSDQLKPQLMFGLKTLIKICKTYVGSDFVMDLKPKAMEIYQALREQ